MKLRIKISIVFLFFGIAANGQTTTPKFIPDWFLETFDSLELDKSYEIGAYLKPLFLEADFNGDKKEDVAATLINSENHKLGLLIIFKDSNTYFVIGAGSQFGSGGDDLRWADTWNLLDQRVTHETTFLENGDVGGTREIILKHPAGVQLL